MEIFLDNEHKLGIAHYGIERPDVAECFPPYADAAKCGFDLEIPLSNIPSGPHTLQVIAKDSHDRKTDLAGFDLGIEVSR